MNEFKLTETETATVQVALKLLLAENFGSHNSKKVRELKALFQPHGQHGYAELCGRTYCRCYQ